MKRRVLGFLAVFLFAIPAAAQKEEAKAQDYSREKLLLIFNATDDEEEQPSNEPDMTFEYSTKDWTFRWLPFLTSIIPNVDSGRASLMPVPSAFTLLGMEYPETADTYPLRGEQSRYRRRMISVVHQANRAEKAMRLRGSN
jgi:hypothetical protein